MSEVFNKAQMRLAKILAFHEAAWEIDLHEPGMAGFLACYEQHLSPETKAMLAEYEIARKAARALFIRYAVMGEPIPATLSEEDDDE